MTTDRNSEGAELLPCPHCGSGSIARDHRLDDATNGYNVFVTIACGCGARVIDRSEQDNLGWSRENLDAVESRAIASWNRRASPSAAEVLALVERMDSEPHGTQVTRYWRDELAKLIPRNPGHA